MVTLVRPRLPISHDGDYVVASLRPSEGTRRGEVRNEDIRHANGDLDRLGYLGSNAKFMVALTLHREFNSRPRSDAARAEFMRDMQLYMSASHADMGTLLAARALRERGQITDAEVRTIQANVSADSNQHGMRNIPQLRDKVDRLFVPLMAAEAARIGIKVAPDAATPNIPVSNFTNVSGAYWGAAVGPASQASMRDVVRMARALHAIDDGAFARHILHPANPRHTTARYPAQLGQNGNIDFVKTGTLNARTYSGEMRRELRNRDVAVLTIGYRDAQGEPHMVFYRTNDKQARIRLAGEFQDTLMRHPPAPRATLPPVRITEARRPQAQT